MPVGTGLVAAQVVTALGIAALHALIPSHWLSFAVVGRVQKWSLRQTLTVTALAGTGHMALTVALGLLASSVGKTLLARIPPGVEHGVTGAVLIALGLYFLVPALRGQLGCHHHAHEHEGDAGSLHSDGEKLRGMGGFPTIMGALVAGMTLSPCLDLLSVYVGAVALPWPTLLWLSAAMSLTTVGIMVALVGLTSLGLRHLKLRWLERHEGAIVGTLLIALGILLFFLP